MKHAIALGLVLGLVACDENPPKKDATPAATTTAATTAATTPATAPTAAPQAKGPFPASTHAAMKDPSQATEQAPDKFTARFETTAGDFEVECVREWAPNGVDRFYNLVKIGYFNDVAFFRAMKGFMVQWGIHGDPEVNKQWSKANIEPDAIKQSNTRGMLTFAQAGRPSEEGKTAALRSTQLFINYADNSQSLDPAFAPVCKVTKGMENVDKIHQGYGDAPSRQQPVIQSKGNAFLRATYPELDYIKSSKIVEDAEGAGGGGAGGGDAAEKAEERGEAKGEAKAEGKGEPKAEPKAAEPKAAEPKAAEPKPAQPKTGGGTGKGDGSGSGKGAGSGKGDGSGQGQ